MILCEHKKIVQTIIFHLNQQKNKVRCNARPLPTAFAQLANSCSFFEYTTIGWPAPSKPLFLSKWLPRAPLAAPIASNWGTLCKLLRMQIRSNDVREHGVTTTTSSQSILPPEVTLEQQRCVSQSVQSAYTPPTSRRHQPESYRFYFVSIMATGGGPTF